MNLSEPVIEAIFATYEPAIGKDLAKYRNHVYRVFKNCLLLDPDAQNREIYAIAAVFHDIGIWTDHTIDYLDPSIAQAARYLRETGAGHLEAQVSTMIYWHHKVGAYTGPFARTAEVFRKADWADVSLGLLTFGMDRARLRQARAAWPNAGFHLFLVRKILPNLLSHPLNPLPMFKK
ncbi:hypothetical protein GCM10010967_55230 [Dyadobacter beijingensis]|uniref:HD domain-containing protein n=1 Tax=Dyadobacter beijingensis TaxID=365489 RepID=A0ABQ2II48_9BACT|nr:HD domain-containing protein [Dyadobacter beijingensis]GGN12177.1 hypothetical protein GCM10010967_55230 [Dyadobacter beijingensis]